jgi:hypothetical protein
MLDLVGVQEGRWGRGDTEPAGEYILFYGNADEAYIVHFAKYDLND